MITPTDKRQASLSILQRLRRQGLPPREERMESMFDSLASNEEEKEEEGEEPKAPEYEFEAPEEQEPGTEKKKGPKLDQGKVGKFKKGFMSVR